MNEQDAALQHVNRAWEWFGGMVCISATRLGIELGLFDAIRERGSVSPAELAAMLNLQPRPVETWAKTLLHHGLLELASNDEVRLAPGVALMVCEPRTLLNLAPSFVYHGRYLAADFLDLPELFRNGTTRPPSRHGRDLSLNVADQTAAMQAMFMAAVLPQLDAVDALLRSGAQVLDAGCGTGNLGVHLASEYDDVTYTGIDLDEDALSRGRAIVRRLGLDRRVTLRMGDIASLSTGGAYDIAFLFLALHEISPEARPAALAALRVSLKPGGVLVIFDERYPETLARAAERGARSGLHFEYTEMLWGSRVPTDSELDELLAAAGFPRVERETALEGSLELILAWNL